MKSPFSFRRNPFASRRGFTLMEMLIVLSIIALLMGMVIFQVSNIGSGANVVKVNADILTFKEMLASYQLESGTLPTTDQGLKVLWSQPTSGNIPAHWHAQLEQETFDPWGRSYQYQYPGKHNPDRYDIYSLGQDGLPNTADDIGNWKTTTSSSQ